MNLKRFKIKLEALPSKIRHPQTNEAFVLLTHTNLGD